MPDWQVRFDGGHQQRYLPDRAVLSYPLAITSALAEVIDLSRRGETDRLRSDLSPPTGNTP